jgi:hypothetical protein
MKIIETVKTPNTVFTIELEGDIYKIYAIDNNNPAHKIELNSSESILEAKVDLDFELNAPCWDCGRMEIEGHALNCDMILIKLS